MKPRVCHTLPEACSRTGLPSEVIVRFVSFNWILPADWQHQLLDEEDLARACLIHELQEEFGVNDDAIPIILHLIDQLNRIHLEMRARKESQN